MFFRKDHKKSEHFDPAALKEASVVGSTVGNMTSVQYWTPCAYWMLYSTKAPPFSTSSDYAVASWQPGQAYLQFRR